MVRAPDSESWWDVPVPHSTTQARRSYEDAKARQRPYLGGTTQPEL
jgi:hypothetical protein